MITILAFVLGAGVVAALAARRLVSLGQVVADNALEQNEAGTRKPGLIRIAARAALGLLLSRALSSVRARPSYTSHRSRQLRDRCCHALPSSGCSQSEKPRGPGGQSPPTCATLRAACGATLMYAWPPNEPRA